MTPLFWGVALGHGEVVRALLENRADPNARESSNGDYSAQRSWGRKS